MSSAEIKTRLITHLERVDEEIAREDGWPLEKKGLINRFAPIITETSNDGGEYLATFLIRLYRQDVIHPEKVRNHYVFEPFQVEVIAALYFVQQELGITPLSTLVPTTKEILGDHPLANLIRKPGKRQPEEGEIKPRQPKVIKPVETPPEKPSYIPNISEEQITLARLINAASLSQMPDKITGQPGYDILSFSKIGLTHATALMILFIRAFIINPKKPSDNFHPDLLSDETDRTDTILRVELQDGTVRCLGELNRYRQRAEKEGREPEIQELGELFLRVKEYVEKQP